MPRPPLGKLILHYWLPAIFWLVAVALFSSKHFSARNTNSLLALLLSALHLHVTFPTLMLLNYLVRKAAHFSVYALLSALFFRAFRASSRVPRNWRWSWAVFALLVCLAAASADEIHQTFVPGRTGTWKDTFLDMLGAGTMQGVILMATNNRKARVPRI